MLSVLRQRCMETHLCSCNVEQIHLECSGLLIVTLNVFFSHKRSDGVYSFFLFVQLNEKIILWRANRKVLHCRADTRYPEGKLVLLMCKQTGTY
uniref:Uncharacterized protein n=1 Tax=Anguilla anguilla TaxID=7936 RepID=A0A0E9WXV8_ANGAN